MQDKSNQNQSINQKGLMNDEEMKRTLDSLKETEEKTIKENINFLKERTLDYFKSNSCTSKENYIYAFCNYSQIIDILYNSK